MVELPASSETTSAEREAGSWALRRQMDVDTVEKKVAPIRRQEDER